MENNLAKKIFNNENEISREQFNEALSKGDFMENILAQQIMQSDLEIDAFVGYLHTNSSLSDLGSLDNKIESYLKTQNKPNSNSTYIIGIWLIMIIAIASLAFLLNEKPKTTSKTSSTSQKLRPVKYQNTSNVQTNETFELTKEKFIVKEKKVESNTTQSIKNSDIEFKRESTETFSKMEFPIIIYLDQRNKYVQIKKPLAKEVMLSEFIFVDYRGIRVEKKFNEANLKGLPANLQTQEETKNNLETETDQKTVSYYEFLKETAFQLKSKMYNAAAQRFKIILKQYPDDINALFYLAYIKYNQGAYSESLTYLEQIEKLYFGNFEEETAWYILKNQIELKNNDLIQKQAQKIIEMDGFYKKQAEDLLNQK